MIKNKTVNILVFPCGTEIAIEVYNSLSVQKNIKLFGASSVEDNGRFVFENYIGNIPTVSNDNFVESIKDIVHTNKIDFIYPCMDVVMSVLKKHEDYIGCTVLCSPANTVDIVSRKSLTYKHLQDHVRTPRIFTVNTIQYPAFSKPDIGSSSRNTLLIEDDIDLKYSLKKYPNNLLLEYLPGDEYTVDCFTDRNRKLLFVGPRLRARVSNGISVDVKNFIDPKINDIANTINNSIELIGSWFFQLKKDINNDYCLLEVATRFAGSSVINRIRGVNFAYLTLLNQFDVVEIHQNNYDVEVGRGLDIKSKTSLHYKKVYLDLDDTLIVNEKINTDVIKFIYKCHNNNIDIILLTKHKNSINKTLSKYKIPKILFTKIIQITKTDNKYDYIDSKDSIFIDDSYSERIEVFNHHNIPVISIENIMHI